MPAKRKPSPPQPKTPEQFARQRSLKGNTDLADKFGVMEDIPREVVKVDSLPDPPRQGQAREFPEGQGGAFDPSLPLPSTRLGGG